MDKEIGYASHAGINYWAFNWYPPGNGMELARNLFLASSKRERLKWCVVLATNPFDMNRDAPWLAAEFAKPGCQKVLDGRPLDYLFMPIALKARTSKALHAWMSGRQRCFTMSSSCNSLVHEALLPHGQTPGLVAWHHF